MTVRLNRILDERLIERVLKALFINRPVSIIKTIARSGRGKCSVPWVYFQNDLTLEKRSTFISFRAILDVFWEWLETVELFALAVYQRAAISEVVYQFIQVGDRVYHSRFGWVEVVEKERTERLGLPRVWVETDSSIEKVEPYFLSGF